MNTRQSLGRWGEALAADYLRSLGYSILEQNVHTPYGEIDLIARLEQPQTLVFVEVKTRRSPQFGLPEDAVNLRKQTHLLSAINHYLQQHPELQGDPRVDVIAIQLYHADQPPVITHFENAIS